MYDTVDAAWTHSICCRSKNKRSTHIVFIFLSQIWNCTLFIFYQIPLRVDHNTFPPAVSVAKQISVCQEFRALSLFGGVSLDPLECAHTLLWFPCKHMTCACNRINRSGMSCPFLFIMLLSTSLFLIRDLMSVFASPPEEGFMVVVCQACT